MKTVDIVDSGTNESNGAFTIAATGKAFRILSDGLYSDKIAAVIRELSCNAYDSHIAAGKPDLPFEVHLPSEVEPWFSVTDFGTGISDEDITKIYTRYFASTKTNSNDFVGQLGLGSKSPFSLVREFEVKSSHSGVERTYRMYFDDTDTPRVEFLYEGPNVQSGLSVKFAVHGYSDQRRFAERADTVLGWFKTTPTITGNVVRINKTVSKMTEDGWFIRAKQTYGNNSPIALMGNVAYPIDTDIEGISPEIKAMLDMPLVIHFDIGELEVSASRESLGYDKRTVANLTAKCHVVLDQIRRYHAGQIAACQTEWQARTKYESLIGYDSPHQWQYRDIFKDYDIIWNGVKIDSSQKKVDLKPFYDLNTSGYRAHIGHAGKSVLSRVCVDELGDFIQPCNDKNIVVFNNVDRGGLARIKHWLKTSLKESRVTVYDQPVNGDWEQLRAALGMPEVTWSDSMPVPPRKASAGRSNMMEWKGSTWNRHNWENVDVDMDEGGYWIDVSNKAPVSRSGKTIALGDLVREAVLLGMIPANSKIYAPKGNMRNKIHKMEDWVNIVDLISDETKKAINNDIANLSATVAAWEDIAYKNRRMLHYDWQLRDPDSTMAKFMSFVNNMVVSTHDENIARYRKMQRIGYYVGLNLDNGKSDTAIEEMLNLVKKRYPLLFVLSDSAWTGTMVNEYVNMVDQNHVWYTLSTPTEEETQP